jgi:hypothetical protein
MHDASPHACLRRAQRHISPLHEDLAHAWGEVIRQPGGRRVWFLGRKAADRARAAGAVIPEAAVNVAVVVARDGTVVTVIRSSSRRRLERFARPSRSRRRAA